MVGIAWLWARALAWLLAAVAGTLGCRAASRPVPPSGGRASARDESTPPPRDSNVARADYAGSSSCAGCHPDVVKSWASSPMHRMTRASRGADVRAPFDGARWAFGRDAALLEKRGEDRVVRIEHGGGGVETYRVTRVLGGRTREDFVGVADGSDEEVVLPVSFVFSTGALRYKGYSVMVHERTTLRAGPVWSRTCVFCHNTVPEMDRLLGAVAAPRTGPYQGEQVDPWLPVERRVRWRVIDDQAFARDAGAEAKRFGALLPETGSTAEIARATVAAIRSGFSGKDLVEEGIGCEACHGGCRRHAADPRVSPSLVPQAPWLTVELPVSSPSRRRHDREVATNRVCARCHQVLFSRYPFTWEGGRRDGAAGGSHISSGEARDFLLGACASQLACTSCHDPHGADDPSKMQALVTPLGNGVCTNCHPALSAPEAVRAHSHHDPRGRGAACVACHMPRKNMGLDGQLTTYHRIGSPTDAERVLGDRPLECALCHEDKAVRSLVDAMESWWPVRYPRQRLQELYGSLDANVISATLERGKAHEQAVALGVVREARDRARVALVARQLDNEYPLVRTWAKATLAELGEDHAAAARAAASAPAAPSVDAEEPPED